MISARSYSTPGLTLAVAFLARPTLQEVWCNLQGWKQTLPSGTPPAWEAEGRRWAWKRNGKSCATGEPPRIHDALATHGAAPSDDGTIPNTPEPSRQRRGRTVQDQDCDAYHMGMAWAQLHAMA
jgi:hypothetical protein